MKRMLLQFALPIVWIWGLLIVSAPAATNTRTDIADNRRMNEINGYNIGRHPVESRDAVRPTPLPGECSEARNQSRSPVGSAQSTNIGTGPGVSVDLTWADEQWGWGTGRQIDHWWNGASDETMEVSVHFAYLERPDTIAGYPFTMTGYNVYDAAVLTNNWPRGQDIGCDLQIADTLGSGGRAPSLAMTFNGRAIIGARAAHWLSHPTTGARVQQNFMYYQGSEFSCTYDPRSSLNVTFIDTVSIQANLMQHDPGLYASMPTIATQWDGTNTILHVGLHGLDAVALYGNDYCSVNDQEYSSYVYFRKVGSTAGSGTWSAGRTIDSLWYPWASLAVAPYPYTGVAVTYTNPTYYACLLDLTIGDIDVWCRESFDRGLTWPESYSVTNYANALAGDPNHFAAWLESGCMFDSEGDLHVWWTAKPTSTDPYFDGFNWTDFDENLYHWEKTNYGVVPGRGDAVKVANGDFMDDNKLTGSMNTLHCGFGGSNAGYLGWITMGECDSRLYMIWSQIHERANRFPWRDAATQPAPGVLDDCSYDGQRLGRANWELMMSVAQLSSSTLWDVARNISNTYTPDCGLPGDPFASSLCGSEWKPSCEIRALDETGLDITWPSAAIVDMSLEQNYAGGWYLNMEYMDDQYPGPYNFATNAAYNNPPGTENSEKWIRLACVQPVEASQIDVTPKSIEWPVWIQSGHTAAFTITVVNDGNVVLNVTEVGDNRPWLSHDITTFPFQVTAGVVRTATFTVSITAPVWPTQWLDGELWLKSDAANNDSVPLLIHVLAADNAATVLRDTVMTHPAMFDPFFDPPMPCVALSVTNFGEMGACGAGKVNLDYFESGFECLTSYLGMIYLHSGSPFVITATDEDGTNALLTTSYHHLDQAPTSGWDPVTTGHTMTGGTGPNGKYDSVFTGRMVNRDTTIAMERIFYAPRFPAFPDAVINYVVCHSKVFSADGSRHTHVTVGDMINWDIPSDLANSNTSHGMDNEYVFVQGTDTANSQSCFHNTSRCAAEAFGGAYVSNQEDRPCLYDPNMWSGSVAVSLDALVDKSVNIRGEPLAPPQPDPLLWWDEVTKIGVNANAATMDQAVILTYKLDWTLEATDTLRCWTVLLTRRDMGFCLESDINIARKWFKDSVLNCPTPLGCCVGKIGDANGSGEDMPTIGDISVMIDAKFITGVCIAEGAGANIRCLGEADANLSGGTDPTCGDISIGDISMLIDCLFITGEPPFVRNNCGQ